MFAFPNSPSVGTAANGYAWDGEKWAAGAGPAYALKSYVDTQDAAIVTVANAAYQAKDAQLFAGIPILAPTFPYTLIATDAQKAIRGTGTATIPAQASVNFPIGTVVTFIGSGGVMTIAITTDALYWINGSGTLVGGAGVSRSLLNGGIATAVKGQSGLWNITGNGLS